MFSLPSLVLIPPTSSALEPIETQLGIGCVLKIEATIVNLHTRQSWSSQVERKKEGEGERGRQKAKEERVGGGGN